MSICMKDSRMSWDLLDGFVRDLQACPDTGAQVRLAVETVREALGADLVFWCSCTERGAVITAGTTNVTPEWCRSLARRHIDRGAEAGGQVLQPSRGTLTNNPCPSDVALVRISRTHDLWLVAVRFDGRRPFEPADVRWMAFVRRLLLAQRRHWREQEKLKASVVGLVRSLMAAINAKNPYTGGHSERVGRIALRLGQQMGLPAEELGNLYLGGLLHDVGKIGMRSSVLQKPGRLTPAEMAHVREHPIIGDAVVANVAELAHLRPAVRHHHERFDGQGYPDRLAGPAIPLVARILAVADACDAMASARAYRLPLPTEQVDAILTAGAGSQWDPDVIAAFLACRDEVYAICDKGLGDSVLAAVAEVVRAVGQDEG
jgi:HD-GYP domain-containing protein (c-di-GMP phosphodiesterase class II)